MKVRVEYINEFGEASQENIRWWDEVAEAAGMSDAEADAFEAELIKSRRAWIDGSRCAYLIQEKR